MDPGLAAWLVPLVIGFSASWAQSLKLQGRPFMKNRQSVPSFQNRPPGNSQLQLFLGSAVPSSGAPLQYPYPLQKVYFNVNSLLQTFDGQEASINQNTGQSINPFLTQVAKGGASKQILSSATPGKFVFAVRNRASNSSPSISNFSFCASCVKGSATLSWESQTVQVPIAGNIPSSVFAKIVANNAFPNSIEQTITVTFTSVNTRVEVWLKEYDATEVSLVTSAVVMPVMTSPVLSLEPDLGASANYKTLGTSKTNQEIPSATLECDQDLYKWCRQYSNELLLAKNISLRCDAVVKPKFFRIDLQYPKDHQDSIVNDGPFAEVTQAKTNAPNVKVPSVFVDDVLQLMTTFQFDQTQTYGLRRFSKDTTDSTGPIKLSANDIKTLLFSSGQTTLQSFFVRNDSLNTLSIGVLSNGSDAPFWVSPTCSQSIALQENSIQTLNLTVLSMVSLSDEIVVNNEDFCIEIIDLRNRQTLQKPVVETIATASSAPTSYTNPLYPNLDSDLQTEFPVTTKNISWLYLTPFNNLVSLKVTQRDGTSEWVKTSQGSLPLLKVPWKQNSQHAYEIVPVNLGIFNGSLFGAGASSNAFQNWPKQSQGVSNPSPYDITAGQLAQTFLNVGTNYGAEYCIDVQINKLLLDFFQDDAGQSNLKTWPPINWSAPTSANSNNTAYFQFYFVSRWNSLKQVQELQVASATDPNDPLTRNLCPLVPLPTTGSNPVVSVSLDYSDAAPLEFRNDPRFLTSAKFFGLACEPHSEARELVLGSGSPAQVGETQGVVPQSWVPMPSQRLRNLDIENARSITNSPNVLSFSRNANKGRLWKNSNSEANLFNLYSNNDAYLGVLQDILSTVNVEGYQSIQKSEQWSGNFSDATKVTLKGTTTGPAIQLRQNQSKYPSLLDLDYHVNMSQDPSSASSLGPKPASKLPRWVGYSQFGLRLRFESQSDFGLLQTALANQTSTTVYATAAAPRIVVDSSNNKFQIEAFTQQGHLIGTIVITEGLYASVNALATQLTTDIQSFAFDFENIPYLSTVTVTDNGSKLNFVNTASNYTIVFNFSSSAFVENTMLHDCAVLLGFEDKIYEVGSNANPLTSNDVQQNPEQQKVYQFGSPPTDLQSPFYSLAYTLANATASLFSQNPSALLGGSLGGPNDPLPATNFYNQSQPFATAPCFVSASDGVQSSSLVVFWAFLLSEAQGRQNPGVQVLLDTTLQTFQICVDTSKMNITSLAGYDQLGFDSLGLSLTEPSDVLPQAVPQQILCVNASSVIESNNNWVTPSSQKVTESRYNNFSFSLASFDECFVSMRQQLQSRDVSIHPNAVVLDTTGETAQAIKNDSIIYANWISTVALEPENVQNLTLVVTSTSATEASNVLNASNINPNTLDQTAVRAIGDANLHQSPFNFQGLMENQIQSQMSISEVAGTLLGFGKMTPIMTNPQQNWYAYQRKNSLRLSQWSSSEFQFPMQVDGPSTLHPRNVIPLGLIQSVSNNDWGQNLAPTSYLEMPKYNQMFGGYTSPVPVQVSAVIPLSNPYVEDSIIAGQSSNSIGNQLVTPLNNIVCLEAKLTFGWSQDDPSIRIEKKGFLVRHEGLVKLQQGPQNDVPLKDLQPLQELPTGPVTFNGLAKVLQEAINTILVQFVQQQTSRQVVIGSTTNTDDNAVFEIVFQDVVVPMQSPGHLEEVTSIQTWSPVDNVPTLIQTTRILKLELQLSNATVSSFTGVTNPYWANLEYRDRCIQSGILFGVPPGQSSQTFGQTSLQQGDTLPDVYYKTVGTSGTCPQSPVSEVWNSKQNQIPTNVYYMDGYALRPQQEFQSANDVVLADKKLPSELTDVQIFLSESNDTWSFGINPPGQSSTVIVQDGILNGATSATYAGAWTGPNFAIIQDIQSIQNLTPSVLHNIADSHLTAGIYGTGPDLTAGPQGISYDIVVDTYVLPNETTQSFTGPTLNANTSIAIGPFLADQDRTQILQGVTGITGNTASITGTTGTFSVSTTYSDIVTNQLPISGNELSFRSPPYIFVDSSVTSAGATAVQNNLLALYAFTNKSDLQSLAAFGPRNVQQTTEFGYNSLQPISDTFAQPVNPTGQYPTLQTVSATIQTALGNWAQGCTAIDKPPSDFVLQELFFNGTTLPTGSFLTMTVENDLATASQDPIDQAMAERQRLHFQNTSTLASHGLFGLSYGLDPYLGTPFSKDDVVTANFVNRQSPQTRTLQTSSSTLGFAEDTDFQQVAYKNINDCIVLAYRANPLFPGVLSATELSILQPGETCVVMDKALFETRCNLAIAAQVHTDEPGTLDDLYPLKVAVTRTPNGLQFPGAWRLELLPLRSDQEYLSQKFYIDQSLVPTSPKIRASAKAFGFPLTVIDNDHQTWTTDPAVSQNSFKVLTTSPYRVLTYPIATLNVVDQLNNAIQFFVGTLPANTVPIDINSLLVRQIPGGTFAKPTTQNAVEQARALTQVVHSLSDPNFASVSFEARNWYPHLAGGVPDDYVFSNVWTLYMVVSSSASFATDVYLFLDDTYPTTSDSPWTIGQYGALNQSQMRSSGTTLGFSYSQVSSVRSLEVVSGITQSLPCPLGNFYNDPIKYPQMQSNFDFVPFHATLGSNDVPVHLPLFFQISITYPTLQIYENVIQNSNPFGSQMVSNGDPLAETFQKVPQAFMEDVISALLGPSPDVIQQVSSVNSVAFQNLSLLSGLLQYNMGTPSSNGPLPVFTQSSQPQDPGSLSSANFDAADAVMASQLITGNTVMNAQTGLYVNRNQLAQAILTAGSKSTTHTASGVQAQCAQWADDNVLTLNLRFAGQVLDFTTSARPFAVDATKVTPQPYSLVTVCPTTVENEQEIVATASVANPTVDHPWPVWNAKDDTRNLYCQSTQGNDAPSDDQDSIAGLPRQVLPWTQSESATASLLNPIETLAKVSIWTDVDITRPSILPNQVINYFMGPPPILAENLQLEKSFAGIVPWFPQVSPQENVGFFIRETLQSGPTVCLDALSAIGSPGCSGIGGAPFELSFYASQQGTHEFWFRVQIIAGTNQVDGEPNNQILAEYVSDRVPLITDAQNAAAAVIKIQTANIPYTKLPSSSRLRFTLYTQLLQPELYVNYPNVEYSQNAVSILTNYDGTNQAGYLPCESPPTTVVYAILKTPLGPSLIGASQLDTNQGETVFTEPSLWKPTDNGRVPYANGYSSFLKAEGVMASTNEMSLTNFAIISDVNISPSALFDGRQTDQPRIWFHGATPLSSTLPLWDINWGIVQKSQASVSLGAFGYSSTGSIQFNTGRPENEVYFGIFPQTPQMWLTNNGGLSLTSTFANSLIEATNEGFLGPLSTTSLFNMYDSQGGGYTQKQSPFVPNGDSNGLPLRVPWTSTLGNNVTSNTNAITLKQTTEITEAASTLGTSLKTTKTKTLFWPIGHYDGQQLAEAIQSAMNTFIKDFQNLSDAVNVDINQDRGLEYLTFEVLNKGLLNAQGLAPISIVNLVELPKLTSVSSIDRSKTIGGLNQCGLALGLRLQKEIQVGRPIQLNTQDATSLLIVEGSNDLIPLIFRPRHSSVPIEVPDLHDTIASGTINPGSQTLDELALEIQTQLNAKLERFRYETQTDVPTTLVVQCGSQESGISPFPVISNFSTASTTAEFSSIQCILQDGFRFLGIGLYGSSEQSLVVSQDGSSWTVLNPLPILSEANIDRIVSFQMCKGTQGILQNICAEVFLSENANMIFSTFDFNEFKIWKQGQIQLENVFCASASKDDPQLFAGGQNANLNPTSTFCAVRISNNSIVEGIPSVLSSECFAIGQVPNEGSVIFVCNNSALSLSTPSLSNLSNVVEFSLPSLPYSINGASIAWSPTLQLFLVTFRSIAPSNNANYYVFKLDPVSFLWTPWPLIGSLNLNFSQPSSIVDGNGQIFLNAVSNVGSVAEFYDITNTIIPQVLVGSTPNLIINQMIAAQVFLQSATTAPPLFGPNSIQVRVLSRNVPTGVLSNFEFLWCDQNESLFGTIGISQNPEYISSANKLQQTYSAQTFGFAVQGTLSTLWLGSPVLAPNPILSPSFVNDTLLLQTRNGSLTSNQSLIPFRNVGLSFSAADTDFPNGLANYFSQDGNVNGILPFGPTLTPWFQTLLRANLGKQYNTDADQIDQLFQLPLSAFDVQLAQFSNGIPQAKKPQQERPKIESGPLKTSIIVTDPITFLEPGTQSFQVEDYVPQDAIVVSLEVLVIGAGGGSAYGIGGAGIGIQGEIFAKDYPEIFERGTFQVVVGEGGRVPHGLPTSATRKSTVDSLGGGSKALWPGSAGGGASQIVHAIQDSTELRNQRLVVLAGGGGGAGCHDSTPGNFDPKIPTSLAGSADNVVGLTANNFPQFSNAQFASGGQGGVVPLAKGGTCAGRLPENPNLHDGSPIDPILFSNVTGGQSIQGGGGGGGGFVGGGAGCAILSNPRSSTAGGGGRSFYEKLRNVRFLKAKTANNQRFLGKNELDVSGNLLQGASGFFLANNAALLNDDIKDILDVPIQKKSEGHSGAVSVRIVQKLPTVVFGCTSSISYGTGTEQLPEAQVAKTNFPQTEASSVTGIATAGFAYTGVFTSANECYLTQSGLVMALPDPLPPAQYESSLQKSTDGGLSFTKVTTNLTSLLFQEARLTQNYDATNPVVIASGRNPQNSNTLAKSNDFVNWTLLPSAFAPGYAIGNFYDTISKRWQFGGDSSLPNNQKLAFSDDPSPTNFTFSSGWTSPDLPISVNGISARDSIVVAVGEVAGGQATPTYDLGIAQSQDKGLTWNPAKSMTPLSLNGNVFGVAYGNGVFVACGLSTPRQCTTMFSKDGIHWTASETQFNQTLGMSGIAFTGSVFVVIWGGLSSDENYRQATSTDGNIWTPVNNPTMKNVFLWTVFSNEKYV